MKRALALLVGAFVLLAAPAPVTAAVAAPKRITATPGTLVLIGGANSDPDIFAEVVRLAGGANAKIGVLSTSSAIPNSSAKDAIKDLKAAGAADAVWIPVTEKKTGSGDDPANVALAQGMTGFYFTGGDQIRYVNVMIHSDGTDGAVLAAIRAKFQAGAPLAGTSAGMQIMSGPDMITGGDSYRGIRDGAVVGWYPTDEQLGYLPAGGFGFVTSGLVDTHFGARSRHGRSIRLAADTGHDRVYGVDENTALEISGTGQMTVIGQNGVSVLDLAPATVGTVGGRWSISGVRWDYLKAGDAYNPATRTVIPGHAPVAPADKAAAAPSADIFGAGALVASAVDLAGSGRSTSTTGDSAETGPQFTVELSKLSGFVNYGGSFTGLAFAVHVK
ncbi:cyanophycinase [Nonomuraea sediminis]|uniref:cyanophycinase n=1 Tax=Nonomuraea sediminis TaxID=2835864 RepID=UPI001BDC2988|nr:cyanophycinase [Nonomuraea sediminis]